MKFKLVILLFLFSSENAMTQVYQLKLNDTLINITIEKEYKVYLNGKSVILSLTSQDSSQFDNDVFSFKYPKEYKPSKHLIDSTAEQYVISTGEGSAIIIQQYFSINPENLNELMLREITKESIEYGFKMKREDYYRTLVSGQSIKVTKAILTYKDDVYTYEVAAISKKDEGLLVMTIKQLDSSGEGKKLIELLWNSLKYK